MRQLDAGAGYRQKIDQEIARRVTVPAAPTCVKCGTANEVDARFCKNCGAGLVKVVMTCKHDVKRVMIDPLLVGEDKEMLEDLVAAAFNDAARRVESTVTEKMAGFTAGMGLPPGLKLPF